MASELAAGAPIVLHGRSTFGDRRPLAPIRAAVDAYVRLRPELAGVLRTAAGPAAALVKNLSPALAEVLAAADVDGRIGPDRYARAVAGFLTGLARAGGPVLLRLDDAQWFDEDTIRVLDQLAVEAPGAPLLVVVTSRTAVPAADTTIMLPPLTVPQVAGLIDALSGNVRCDESSAARIALLTGGNPFIVLEYARAAIDAGMLLPVRGRWEAIDGLRDLRLPADSAELMLRRMGELDTAGRRLLGIAAVIGTSFTTELVTEVADADPAELKEVIAHAGRQGLVDGRDGAHTFVHESIRTALLAGFTAAQTRDLHDRIGAALDRRGPCPDAYALAQHCAAGHPLSDPDRTLRTGYAAGALAMAEHAPGTAVTFLEQALATADQAGLIVDGGFRRLLGTAYHYIGRFDDALASLTAALEQTADPAERAQIYCLLARVHDRAWNGAQEVEAVERGLAELGRPMPRNAAVLVLSSIWLLILGCLVRVTRLGYGTARGAKRDRYLVQAALSHHGASGSVRCLRSTRAVLYAIRLVYPMNRLGRTSERAQDMVAITMAIRMIGLHRLADRIIRAANRLAGELGDPTLTAYIAWMDAIALHGSGRDQGASVQRVLAERDRWLDPGLALDCYAVLGWDWMLRGEAAAAETAFARRQKWIDAGGHADRSAIVAIDATLLALRGRAGEAAVATARSVRNAGQLHEVVDALIARLQTALERGDLGAAFNEAAEEFAALGLRPLDLLPAQHACYVYLAYGRVAQGDHQAARAAVQALAKVTRRPLIAAHHRVLTAALQAPEAALRSLARAEPVFRSVDAPLVAYEAAVVRARALTELGVPGEAARQVRSALSIAAEYGWPHRARRLAVEFSVDVRSPEMPTGPGNVGGAARRSALEQVSLAASRILDPQQLTHIALDQTVRLLGAERSFLFLMDPDTEILTPYAGRDAAGQDLPELSGYSATVVDQVRHSRQALVVTGTEEGEALGARSVVMYGLRSILVAPLQLEDRLLGVVYLDSRIAKGVFTVDDVDLLTAITHHIAVALETARAAQLEVAVSTANRQRDLAETLRAAMARLSGILDPDLVLRELLDTALATPGGDHGWLLDARTHPDSLGELGSRLTVALAHRDGPVGTLVLARDRVDAYSDGDLGVAQALAGQAMVAYDNARLFSQVTELASTDGLTGLVNRRHFFALAPALVAAGAGTVLMLDIDNFKQVNDTYGHQVGDDVIRGVVDRMSAVVPAAALLGRYGGEEFALLTAGAAGDLGEALRAAVAGAAIGTRGGPVAVTISAGSAVIRPGDTIDTVLARADAALYEAKQTGRNRVVAHRE
jgi:diguanylate cyclase (GGDEF)-like protein